MSTEFDKVAVTEIIDRMTSIEESLRILDEAGLVSAYQMNSDSSITEFVMEKSSLTSKMLQSKPSESSHYPLISFDKNDSLVYWELTIKGKDHEVVVSVNRDNYNEVAFAYALFVVRMIPKRIMRTKMHSKSGSPLAE